jgi:HPt (histidine-containing phosphotransfer) domain-containing protein
VQWTEINCVLNREQLREITMDDQELMRELVAALIDDTSRQVLLLDAAIQEADSLKCARLAHYSKGACANLGAESAAALLKRIECRAREGVFDECRISLDALGEELDRLRSEANTL